VRGDALVAVDELLAVEGDPLVADRPQFLLQCTPVGDRLLGVGFRPGSLDDIRSLVGGRAAGMALPPAVACSGATSPSLTSPAASTDPMQSA